MADNYMDNIQMGKDEDAESFALHDAEAREKIDELDGLIAEAKELIDTLQTTQDRMQSTIASAQASIADNAAAITTINNDLSEYPKFMDIRNGQYQVLYSNEGTTQVSISLTMPDDGYFAMHDRTTVTAASPFIRMYMSSNSANNYLYEAYGISAAHSYLMSPWIPVKAGDVISATIGASDVSDQNIYAYFRPFR